MATELSRTFDLGQGAVVVRIKDGPLGNESIHTIYVVGDAAVKDVNAEVARIMAGVDTSAGEIRAAFEAAGWKPDGN